MARPGQSIHVYRNNIQAEDSGRCCIYVIRLLLVCPACQKAFPVGTDVVDPLTVRHCPFLVYRVGDGVWNRRGV